MEPTLSPAVPATLYAPSEATVQRAPTASVVSCGVRSLLPAAS